MRRADVDPANARRFRTGRISVDLTHTGGEGAYAVWELLHTPTDLHRWLSVVVDADVRGATASDLEATKELRAAHRAIADALVAGGTPPTRAVTTMNRAAAEPPLVPELRRDALELRPGSVGQALSTLARDLQDLMAGPLSGRVRICAADDCGLFFVDASRPGRRRWCSMERCGNRQKTRSYRSRHGG